MGKVRFRTFQGLLLRRARTARATPRLTPMPAAVAVTLRSVDTLVWVSASLTLLIDALLAPPLGRAKKDQRLPAARMRLRSETAPDPAACRRLKYERQPCDGQLSSTIRCPSLVRGSCSPITWSSALITDPPRLVPFRACDTGWCADGPCSAPRWTRGSRFEP